MSEETKQLNGQLHALQMKKKALDVEIHEATDILKNDRDIIIIKEEVTNKNRI